MLTGSVLGIFATEEGGVPKPSVDSIDVRLNGVYGERIRDTKHHGGPKRAVCILSNQTLESLQLDGHPITGGSTGENLLLDVAENQIGPGVRLKFRQVELEITTPAPPCNTIQESFTNGDFKQLSHKLNPLRTRWYAKVIQEGIINSGETFYVKIDG
jgi:MOSC domain-containing protein YiiM